RWCHEARLLALPRATQNLANAVLEEGDWRRCVALMEERLPEVPGGHSLAASYSAAALRAYAAGDLDAVVAAVEASVDLPGGRWRPAGGGVGRTGGRVARRGTGAAGEGGRGRGGRGGGRGAGGRVRPAAVGGAGRGVVVPGAAGGRRRGRRPGRGARGELAAGG